MKLPYTCFWQTLPTGCKTSITGPDMNRGAETWQNRAKSCNKRGLRKTSKFWIHVLTPMQPDGRKLLQCHPTRRTWRRFSRRKEAIVFNKERVQPGWRVALFRCNAIRKATPDPCQVNFKVTCELNAALHCTVPLWKKKTNLKTLLPFLFH